MSGIGLIAEIREERSAAHCASFNASLARLIKKCVFLNQCRGKLEASLGELDSAKDFSPKKAKKSFAEPKTRA
jgi:hypothetical protein